MSNSRNQLIGALQVLRANGAHHDTAQGQADMDRALAAVDAYCAAQQENRMAHLCIAPACPGDCMGCNHAISAETAMEYAKRYAWLRERDLDAVHEGGVFAGLTPLNVVLNGADLDEAIDARMLPAA